MCFSATASFLTAAVTAGVGAAALTRVRNVREVPLAAIPVVFAAQQAVEGALWLTLPSAPLGAASTTLTHLFLVFALVVWPILAPTAALLLEGDKLRRRIIQVALLIGVAVAVYFLVAVFTTPHSAAIKGGNIAYQIGVEARVPVGGLYLLATAIALLVSSHRAVALLGAIVFVGSIVTYLFYREAFVSVWCFFAAVSSVVIFAHFAYEPLAKRWTTTGGK